MLACCCDPNDLNPDDSSRVSSNITYQVNVYSFADSDGDGWGDLRGVTQHLDYFESLGVTALWLSPIQESASYHGYDVLDYNKINPKLGTEADFRDLIDQAKSKNIDIYMDYVLNHSGKGEWFQSAVSSESSPYRSYYVLSSNPDADVAAGKVDNYGGALQPGMGAWHQISSGNLGYKGRLHFKLDWNAKTVTVTESSDAVQNSNTSASKWLWVGEPGYLVGLYETSLGIHEITVDVDTPWGFLVRTSKTTWDNGTKWGGNGSSISFGQPYTINNSQPADITFGGSTIWYFASFDSSMPDLNYGSADKASESAAFKDLVKSAEKWINMGVNGFRLDAVMWIYQDQAGSNVRFLRQWYDQCNSIYQARGGKGNIYMVGEAFAETSKMASYYRGLPSFFNFSYWWTVKDRIQRGLGSDFAKTVIWFRDQYRQYRSEFTDAIKLSNHDEDRVGEDFRRDMDKMKLAGAVLLTSPGKPFIYQGEELGYWGSKVGGDEYVRTPIKWTKNGDVPAAALNGKVNYSMLTENISVEAQTKDQSSILNVYRKFGEARKKHRALALGEMSEVQSYGPLAMWTMSYQGETVLVAHNFSSRRAKTNVRDITLGNIIVSNGTARFRDGELTLEPYSSAVYSVKE